MLLTGCYRSTSQQLENAMQLMEDAPDSALQVLQSISPSSLGSDDNIALYSLLYFEAQDKNFLPLEPDTLINFAINHYQKPGRDKIRLAKSYFYKARMFKYRADYEPAIANYFLALDNLEKKADFAISGKIFSDLGDISSLQKDYEKAKKYYRMSYRDFSEAQLKSFTIYSILSEGRMCQALNKNDSALYFFRLAINKSYDSLSKSSSLQEIARHYYNVKEFDSALNYSREVIHYPYIGNNKAIRLVNLADVFFDLKLYDSAKYYAMQSLDYNTDILIQSDSYRILTNIDYLRNDNERNPTYFNKYQQTVDSIRKLESQTKVAVVEKIHQSDNIIRSAKKSSRFLRILLIVFSVVAIIVFYFLYKLNEQKKTKIKVVSEELTVVHTKLVKTQEEKIQQLKDSIEKARKAQSIARRNAATNEERERLDIEIYENCLKLKDWKQFSKLMNSTFSDLVSKLQKYPDVKDIEIKWCCLELLDVSHSDKMLILNITSSSLYKLKQRLAIKLNLKGAKELDVFLPELIDMK